MSQLLEMKDMMSSVGSIEKNIQSILSRANQYSNQQEIYKAIQKHIDASMTANYWLARYKYSIRECKIHKAVYFLKNMEKMSQQNSKFSIVADKQINTFLKRVKNEIQTYGEDPQLSCFTDAQDFMYLPLSQRHQHKIVGDSIYYVGEEYRYQDPLWTFSFEHQYRCKQYKQFEIKEFKKQQSLKKELKTELIAEVKNNQRQVDKYNHMQTVFEEHVQQIRNKFKLRGNKDSSNQNKTRLQRYRKFNQQQQLQFYTQVVQFKFDFSKYEYPTQSSTLSDTSEQEFLDFNSDLDNAIIQPSFVELNEPNSNPSSLGQIEKVIKQCQKQKQQKQLQQIKNQSETEQYEEYQDKEVLNQLDSSLEKMLKKYENQKCDINDLFCLLNQSFDKSTDQGKEHRQLHINNETSYLSISLLDEPVNKGNRHKKRL